MSDMKTEAMRRLARVNVDIANLEEAASKSAVVKPTKVKPKNITKPLGKVKVKQKAKPKTKPKSILTKPSANKKTTKKKKKKPVASIGGGGMLPSAMAKKDGKSSSKSEKGKDTKGKSSAKLKAKDAKGKTKLLKKKKKAVAAVGGGGGGSVPTTNKDKLPIDVVKKDGKIDWGDAKAKSDANPPKISVGKRAKDMYIKIDPAHMPKSPLKEVNMHIPDHNTPKYQQKIADMNKKADNISEDDLKSGSPKRERAAKIISAVPWETIGEKLDTDEESLEQANEVSISNAMDGQPPTKRSFKLMGWLMGAGLIALLGGGAFLLMSHPGVASLAAAHAINWAAGMAGSNRSGAYNDSMRQYIAEQFKTGELPNQLITLLRDMQNPHEAPADSEQDDA